MNLHALRIFVEVVNRGGITKAAHHLHISQPAVTTQIKNLEKDLGFTLFFSSGRGIEISDFGVLIYEQAKRLFTLENEIEQQIQFVTRGEIGNIRLFSTNYPATHLLPKWIVQFKSLYPKVTFQLQSGNTQTAFQKLSNFETDLAIIASQLDNQELRFDSLLEDELCFIVHNGHKLANKEICLIDIIKEDFVLREEGSSTRELFFSLCRVSNLPLPKVSIEVSRMDEAIKIVEAGYGISLAPKLAINKLMLEGKISTISVPDVNLRRKIKLFTNNNHSLSPSAISFIDFISKKKLQ